MSQLSDEQDSVRHLVALGYIDPVEVAKREADARNRLRDTLHQATELVRQGCGLEAAPLLESVIKKDPEWIAPRQLLAELHYRAGQWDAAQTAIRWLTLHGVEDPRLALMSGGIALAKRDLQHALENLEYARFASPGLRSVHMLFGTLLLRLGKPEEAKQEFLDAIEQDPGDGRALQGLAAVCLQRGQYEEAADWALQALEKDMRLYRAHYHLGVTLYYLDRPEAAVHALQTAIKVDAARAAPYFWLARIAAEQLHDSQKATAYRQRGRDVVRQRRQERR